MLKEGKLKNEELKVQLFYNRELGNSLYKFFCEDMKAGTVSPFFKYLNLEKSTTSMTIISLFLGTQSRIRFPCAASSRNIGAIDVQRKVRHQVRYREMASEADSHNKLEIPCLLEIK